MFLISIDFDDFKLLRLLLIFLLRLRRYFKYSRQCFTITAEIHARSLVNFYRQYADRHMNFKFARAGNLTICYRKKRIDVSF